MEQTTHHVGLLHPEVVAMQQTDVMRRLFHFTTWFEESHPYGRCLLTSDEAHAAQRAANGLARISLSDVLEEDGLYQMIRPLADEVFRRAAAVNPRANLIVEQTPEHIHAAERILRVYPDAMFVHVIRDPRAVFSSHRGAARDWARPSFFSSDPLLVAREWSDEVECGQRIAGLTDRYLELRYEALIEDGSGELERLYAFLGLDADGDLRRRALASCAIGRMRQADQAPRGFFRRGEAEAWRGELDSGELRAIEFICCDQMVDLGYPLTQSYPVTPPLRLKARQLRRRLGDRIRAVANEDRFSSRAVRSFARFSPRLRRLLSARRT